MSFLNRILKKKEPKPTGTVDSLGVTAISAGGQYKAYIPNFLYKPPFGYPRTDLDLFKIQDLSKTPYVWGVKKAIKDRISATDWSIVPKDDVENTDELKKKAREIEDKLRNPNANQDSFSDVQSAVMEDILNYDSGVIVKVFNKKQKMVEFYARAGYSFLINPDIHGSLRERDDIVEFLFQQGNDDAIMRQSFSAQYKNTAAFFQFGWTPGSLPVPFGKREIIYLKATPRTESVYGYSPIQVLNETILTLLYGGRSALDSYVNNNIPPGILGVSGASQKEIDNIRSRMDDRMNEHDEFNNWRKKPYIMPMIGTREKGSLDFMQFSYNSRDMETLEKQKWYQRLVWSVFGVNANEMGDTESSNKATDIGQSRIIKRRAIKPYLIMLQYAYNTQLLPELDDTGKLKFEFDDYDIEEDFRLNELYEKKMQYMSVNEIRELEGLEEVEDGDKIKGTQDPFNSQFGGDQSNGDDSKPNSGNEDKQEKDESKRDEKEEKMTNKTTDKPKSILPKTEKTDMEKEMINHYKGIEKRIIELVKG